MITKEEVRHIAQLAKLGLAKTEIERFQKDLSSVLEYVEKLKKVDVSKTMPTSHPFEIENATRPDSENPKSKNSKLLELAPEVKEGYIKVKPILK